LLISFLALIVVLGILITVHEFGHFAMAKLLKIRVLVFSLGFGPRLVGFTRGGTEYRISPFPLGGYVKMAGETFDDDRKGEPDEFLSHPKWHRFLVAIAGPFMNILLTAVIFAHSFYSGVSAIKYPQETIVGPVVANSIAKKAGLKTGDRILSVQNNAVKTWEDLEKNLKAKIGNDIKIEIMRDTQVLQLQFQKAPFTQEAGPTDILGFKFPRSKTIVNEVQEGTPAFKAGLKEGDEIIAANGNGKSGNNFNEIMNLISETQGIPLDFTIRRPDRIPANEKRWNEREQIPAKTIHLVITPIAKDNHGFIGFGYGYPTYLQRFGIYDSFRQSTVQCYELTTLTFRLIGKILKGTESVKTLSGPIGIAQVSGSVAKDVFSGAVPVSRFFLLLGFISLQLGIFNLLPIPIMDGGVITLLFIEGIIRRDLSLNIKEKIMQVGFVLILILFGFVMFNDISKTAIFQRLFR
jgi:regulator of sigma E protease